MKFKRILLTLFAFVLLISVNGPPVTAEEPAEVINSYTVTLPAEMILTSGVSTEGFNMGANYIASVKGTIEDGKYVVVTPYERSGIRLTDQSGIEADTKVVQEEVSWASDELGDGNLSSDKDGSVYANIVAPGLYNGNLEFSFYISDKYVPTEYHVHNYVKTLTKEPTCEEDGEYSYMCICGDIHHTEPIPATGHTYLDPVYVWNDNICTATCNCINCEHMEVEQVTATEEIITEATCEEPGEKTYTATFTNDLFTEQTKTVPIEALGHDFGDPTYEWSADNSTCTATRTCKRDESHKETETVTTKIEEKPAATCTEPGLKVYTAEFENEAFNTQTKEEDIPALGHNWGEPVYTWAEDHSTCTAKRVCDTCGEEEEETATASERVIAEATCELTGEIDYIVVFDNVAFKVQTYKVETPHLEHIFEEEVIEPTEIEQGYTLHTCKLCGYSYKDNYTDPTGMPVIVHDPGIYDADWNLLNSTTLTATEVAKKRTRAKPLCKALGVSNASAVVHIVLPSDVTSIGQLAFYTCTNLESIEIPSGCTSIGNGAFMECTSLTSVKMPDTITTIGTSAFNECSSLTSIKLSEGLVTINPDAFSATNISEITIPASVEYIGSVAFSTGCGLTKAFFTDPNNWNVYYVDDLLIEGIDVTDPEIAGRYLGSDYSVAHTWMKE